MINQKNSANSGEYKKRTVHNLIILDESGQMEAIKTATVTGFNEVVQTIKRAFDHDKKARMVHAMKLRRNEDVQERYFEDADDEIKN